jgi:hypothetical protein
LNGGLAVTTFAWIFTRDSFPDVLLRSSSAQPVFGAQARIDRLAIKGLIMHMTVARLLTMPAPASAPLTA